MEVFIGALLICVIILMVLAYMFIGVFIGGLITSAEKVTPGIAWFYGILWPIITAFFGVGKFFSWSVWVGQEMGNPLTLPYRVMRWVSENNRI